MTYDLVKGQSNRLQGHVHAILELAACTFVRHIFAEFFLCNRKTFAKNIGLQDIRRKFGIARHSQKIWDRKTFTIILYSQDNRNSLFYICARNIFAATITIRKKLFQITVNSLKSNEYSNSPFRKSPACIRGNLICMRKMNIP